MVFDPDQQKHDQVLNAPVIEYLGCQPALAANEEVVAVLSFRLAPSASFASHTFSLNKAQVIRLRDDLDSLLTTKGSWLRVESTEQSP